MEESGVVLLGVLLDCETILRVVVTSRTVVKVENSDSGLQSMDGGVQTG